MSYLSFSSYGVSLAVRTSPRNVLRAVKCTRQFSGAISLDVFLKLSNVTPLIVVVVSPA